MTTTLTPYCLGVPVSAPKDWISRWVDGWLDGPFHEAGQRSWVPPMDVREEADHLTVTLEIPGVKKEDVTVTLESGVLTVSGQKSIEKEGSEGRWHSVERRSGSFARSVALPVDVDGEKADADFKEGVLSVRIPKTETVKPRRLTIR